MCVNNFTVISLTHIAFVILESVASKIKEDSYNPMFLSSLVRISVQMGPRLALISVWISQLLSVLSHYHMILKASCKISDTY